MKLIVITALWCPSCLLMKPRIQKVQESMSAITFEHLDFDFDEDKVKALDIGKKLPVYILYNDEGNEVIRFKGEMKTDELERKIHDAMD